MNLIYVNDQQQKRRDGCINGSMLIGLEMKTVIIRNRIESWNLNRIRNSANKKQELTKYLLILLCDIFRMFDSSLGKWLSVPVLNPKITFTNNVSLIWIIFNIISLKCSIFRCNFQFSELNWIKPSQKCKR